MTAKFFCDMTGKEIVTPNDEATEFDEGYEFPFPTVLRLADGTLTLSTLDGMDTDLRHLSADARAKVAAALIQLFGEEDVVDLTDDEEDE